ncbi:MAG: serine protease [Verrucomicrobiia bacterium]
MRLMVLILYFLLASISHCAAQGQGMISEIRVGTNVYRNVTIQQRVGNKLVISHSAGLSAIDIAGMNEETRARFGVTGPLVPTQPITGLILTNQGGTRIAKGHSLFLTASNSLCRLAFQGHAVILRFEHADGDVELWFNGPDNAYLHPGNYENTRSRGSGPIPMLGISSDGLSQEGTGNFNVKEATFIGEKVAVFHATFDFTPENAAGQVKGEVYYNTKAFYPTQALGRVPAAVQTGPRYTALVVNGGAKGSETIFCVAPDAMVKARKEQGGGYQFGFASAQGTREVSFSPPGNGSLHLGKFSGARFSAASGLSPQFRLSGDPGFSTDGTYSFVIKHLEQDELGNATAFYATFSRDDRDGCEGEICFNSPIMYSTNQYLAAAKIFSDTLKSHAPGAPSHPRKSGTGFFISEDGFLVTNEHVVNNAGSIRLVTSDGTIDAKVVQVDADNDLALLKATGKFSPLPIAASRAVRLGGTVATIGFPDPTLQGFAPKLAKGEIAALSGAGDSPRYFQISVPVQPGNSGGALVDEHGNVVGVVSAKLDASVALAVSGALPENVNYAVKSSFLLSFLESVPAVSARLKAPLTADRKFEDVVKSAQDAAVLVLVY